MQVLSGCDSSDAGSNDDNVRIKAKNLSQIKNFKSNPGDKVAF